MGDAVTSGADIQKGTLLATFNRDTGKYAQTDAGAGGRNHRVIFLGWEERNGVPGMRVVEQFTAPPAIKFIPCDRSKLYHSNAYRFSVVMVRDR